MLIKFFAFNIAFSIECLQVVINWNVNQSSAMFEPASPSCGLDIAHHICKVEWKYLWLTIRPRQVLCWYQLQVEVKNTNTFAETNIPAWETYCQNGRTIAMSNATKNYLTFSLAQISMSKKTSNADLTQEPFGGLRILVALVHPHKNLQEMCNVALMIRVNICSKILSLHL